MVTGTAGVIDQRAELGAGVAVLVVEVVSTVQHVGDLVAEGVAGRVLAHHAEGASGDARVAIGATGKEMQNSDPAI